MPLEAMLRSRAAHRFHRVARPRRRWRAAMAVRIWAARERAWDHRGWLILPALALTSIVFIWPVAWLLLRSVTAPAIGTQNYAAVFDHIVYLRVFENTAEISVSVTLICLAVGYPVAYTIVNSGARVQRFLFFVVLIPFWTSLLVRTFAWLVLLQEHGLVNSILLGIGLVERAPHLIHNRIGVLIGMAQVQLPFMILPLYSVMVRIDRRYVQAASTLGARPFRNFYRIYLPLSLPGVMTGCALVFVMCLGYFITPALLGGRQDTMIGQLIQSQIAYFNNWGVAAALSMLLLAGTGAIVAAVYVLLPAARRQAY
jgi:putative spermidine/putrescine transport system permease protein